MKILNSPMRSPDYQNQFALDTLTEKLKKFFNTESFTVKQINSGASVRKYFLIKFRQKLYFPRKNVILMHIPHDRMQMADDYLNISYYLRRMGIPRPRVYEINRNNGWIFVEQAVGTRLDIYLKQNPEEMEKIYAQLLDFLIAMQIKAFYEAHCPAFQRFFDKEKYLYEFDFHIREQLIRYYGDCTLSPSDKKIFKIFANEISGVLHSKLPVFVHRDFQSSNIFYNPAKSESLFQLIDFQDARSGSYVYDLVSLLWDSYITMDEKLREQTIRQFYEKHPDIGEHFSIEMFVKIVEYCAIQRKLHDGGAFVLASRNLRNQSYLGYIDKAVRMAIELMKHYSQFTKMIGLLEKCLRKENDKISHFQT